MEENKLLKKKKKYLDDGDLQNAAFACQKLAALYYEEEKLDEALREYIEGEHLCSAMNDAIGSAVAHRMIGEVYSSMGKSHKALEHQQKYLDIARQEKNEIEEQRALATIGRAYFCLAESIANPDDEDYQRALTEAKYAYMESLKVCERLHGVAKLELMTMRSRLLYNLGLVLESQKELDKAVEYVEKAIKINKQNDLFEDLYRCYSFLATVYVKKKDSSRALRLLNLAEETASRLPDKVSLISDTLSSKADVYFKISDFQAAKQVLIKAYKLKVPHEEDRIHIEKQLRKAVAMSKLLDKIIKTPDTDLVTRKQLYEALGDGCVAVKNYQQALIYYHKMLECAEELGIDGSELASAYVSLAQTYRDNKQFDEALIYSKKELHLWQDNPSEACKTTLAIAQIMEHLKVPFDEIESTYNSARKLAVKAKNKTLEITVLEALLDVLRQKELHDFTVKVEAELEQMKRLYQEAEQEEDESDEDSPTFGNDVCLEDLTDLSDSADEESLRPRHTRSRRCGFQIKRNEKGETQLHRACITGNKRMVQNLLDKGHPVDIRDNCGWLPIHEACNLGFYEIVEILLDNGASYNDPGGKLCGGITPLHDAAANGHLNIVRLLLERGASCIVKTNDGETALDFLLQWHRNVKDLDEPTENLFQAISSKMKDALEKVTGQEISSIPRSLPKDINYSKNRSDPTRFRATNSNYSKRNSEKIADASESNWRLCSPVKITSHDENIDEVTSSSSVISSYLRPHEESDSDNEVSTTENFDYYFTQSDPTSSGKKSLSATEEYKSVIAGLRTKRNMTDPGAKKISRDKSRQNKSSLLADDDIVDDWLEDDMRIFNQPKKKRKKLTLIDYTNSTNRASSDHRHDSRNFDRGTTESTVEAKNRPPQISDFLDSDDFEAEGMEIDSFITNQRSAGVDDVECNSESINSKQRDDRRAVRVNVEGKILYIPLTSCGTTIRTLAKEAARRYHNMEGIEPELILQTTDGAILGDDDPVTIVGEDVIKAAVTSWNLLPVTNRYEVAVSATKSVFDAVLHGRLDACQATNSLSLSNLGIKISSLRPVFRAINRQYALQELLLENNNIGDDGMELLVASLKTLTNLKVLNVSGCNITVVGVKHLSDCMKQDNSVLQVLTSLDLSFNPLKDDSIEYLAVAFANLISLQKLNLKACDFSSRCFNSAQPILLCLDMIEQLDISYNTLEHAISGFLGRLNPSRLVSLEMEATTVCGAIMGEFLLFLEREPVDNLLSLNLSHCHLKDNDILELLRSLQRAVHLESLALSGNVDLTSISLRRLFQHNCSPLSKINLSGCTKIFPLLGGSSLLEWISVRENNVLKSLIVTERSEDNKNSLETMWKSLWDNRAIIKKGPGGLKHFSIKS